jgi:trk system potassium uptake protein
VNSLMVVRQIGRFLVMLAILLFTIGSFAAISWWRGEASEADATWAFLISGSISFGLGGFILIGTMNAERDIGRREACLLVVSTWMVGAIISALPFAFWGSICGEEEAMVFRGFVNPFFEAMSGLTTCGATILSDIESLPQSILLWRSLIQWIGGLGVVVLFVAVLPSLGTGGKRMFLTESTGPTPEGLRPHVRETARTLWSFYLGMTVAEIAMLMLFGMSPFESICHAFTTVSTGGFSTRNGSIAAFDSMAIEAVVTFFMLLSGVGFSLYYFAMRRRFEPIRRSSELHLYLGIVVVVSFCCFAVLYGTGMMNPDFRIDVIGGGEEPASIVQSARYSIFTVVSILTTTGYGTAVFEDWPGPALVCLMGIILVGGMAGSTAGGMKIIRVWIAGKLMISEVEREFRPSVIRPLKIGRSIISPEVRTSAIVLVLFTITLVGVGAGLLKVFEGTDGIDLTTAASAAASAIANVGPGLGKVGADDNYLWMANGSKLTLTALMLLGRLELFVVFALFTRRFWDRG